jgi:hypothetical protein
LIGDPDGRATRQVLQCFEHGLREWDRVMQHRKSAKHDVVERAKASEVESIDPGFEHGDGVGDRDVAEAILVELKAKAVAKHEAEEILAAECARGAGADGDGLGVVPEVVEGLSIGCRVERQGEHAEAAMKVDADLEAVFDARASDDFVAAGGCRGALHEAGAVECCLGAWDVCVPEEQVDVAHGAKLGPGIGEVRDCDAFEEEIGNASSVERGEGVFEDSSASLGRTVVPRGQSK